MNRCAAERTLAAIACALLAAALAGCGTRHQLVERSAGRIDPQRCTMTKSDDRWTVHQPPAPAEPSPARSNNGDS